MKQDKLWTMLYCDDIIQEARQKVKDGTLLNVDSQAYVRDRLDDVIAVYEAILHYEPYCIVCGEKLDLDCEDLPNQQCSLCGQVKEGLQSTAFAICPNGHHVCDDCRTKLREKERNEGTPERADVILTERQADVVVGFLRKHSLIQTATKLGVTRERARLALSGRTKIKNGEEQLVQQGALHKIRHHIEQRRKAKDGNSNNGNGGACRTSS